MLIFAVDPGFDRVGIAFVEKTTSRTPKILFSECFQTDRTDPINKRMFDILEHLERLIKKYRPDILAIEKIYFGKNVKTALTISEVCGAIKILASKYRLEIFEKSPKELKLTITGDGNASKLQVEKMIKRTVELDERKRIDDEYDAIAIGLACYFSNNTI